MEDTLKKFLEPVPDLSDYDKNELLSMYNSTNENLDPDTDFPEIVIDGMDYDQKHAQIKLIGEEIECDSSEVESCDDSDTMTDFEDETKSSDEENVSKEKFLSDMSNESLNGVTSSEEENSSSEEENSSSEEENSSAEEENQNLEPLASNNYEEAPQDNLYTSKEITADQIDREIALQEANEGNNNDDQAIDYFDDIPSEDEEDDDDCEEDEENFSNAEDSDDDSEILNPEIKNNILKQNVKDKEISDNEADDEEDEEGKWKEPEKSWQLKGEVTAEQRGYNTLLEANLEIPSNVRPGPEYTDEVTKSLEDIFKKRILELAFDSIVRKIKDTRDPLNYRKKVELNHKKSEKSLAQIYEDEKLGKLNKGLEEDQEDPRHVQINNNFNKYFKMLDAMTDNNYKPAIPEPTIKVKSQLSSIQMEDVAPVTSAPHDVLAPEEIMQKKPELVADEERSLQDKKRDRRKKKNKQRAMATKREKKTDAMALTGDPKALKMQAEQQLIKKSKMPGSNVEIIKDEGKKSRKTSTAFFSKFQNLQENETQAKRRRLI